MFCGLWHFTWLYIIRSRRGWLGLTVWINFNVLGLSSVCEDGAWSLVLAPETFPIIPGICHTGWGAVVSLLLFLQLGHSWEPSQPEPYFSSYSSSTCFIIKSGCCKDSCINVAARLRRRQMLVQRQLIEKRVKTGESLYVMVLKISFGSCSDLVDLWESPGCIHCLRPTVWQLKVNPGATLTQSISTVSVSDYREWTLIILISFEGFLFYLLKS